MAHSHIRSLDTAHKDLALISDTVEGKLAILLVEVILCLIPIFLIDETLVDHLYLEELSAHGFELIDSHSEEKLLVQCFTDGWLNFRD